MHKNTLVFFIPECVRESFLPFPFILGQTLHTTGLTLIKDSNEHLKVYVEVMVSYL